MSVPSVLIRKSTKQIIKHALYPKADLTPFLPGEIDPDYEWLIEHVPFAEPNYDPRIYVMQDILPDLNFLAEFKEHPQYTGIREYRKTFNPIKRQNAEILLAIDNAELSANELVFNNITHIKALTLAINALIKTDKKLILTPDEQLYLDQVSAVSVKFLKNADEKEIKKAQVLAGLEPSIDLGWESL